MAGDAEDTPLVGWTAEKNGCVVSTVSPRGHAMVAEHIPSGSSAKAHRPSEGPPGGASGPQRRIAGVFLRAAMGPVEYAGGCIMGNKIVTGLEELAPEGLVDALRRGIGDVAKLAGVARSEVESLLPMTDMQSIAQRLRQSQPRALDAWRQQAGQFGFLDVVTALTIDGRRPEIGLCLERVAGKVLHDRHLAEPLEALSVDITAWEDLIVRCRHILEDRGWLGRALRRRTLKRLILGGLGLVALVSVTIVIVTRRIQREDAARRIDSVADCDAHTVSEADLEWATEEQRARLKEKSASCENARAEAAAEEKRDADARAREKAARELHEAREKTCVALASDVEKGTLSEESKNTADKAADLLGRIAKKSLYDSDAGPTDPVFPCADNAAVKKRLEAAFTAALMVDPLLWARRADPSPLVTSLLASQKASLPDNGLIGLADNAERSAKSSLTRGDVGKMATAKRVCALAKALEVAGHSGCNALEKMP